jgi:hypothetical protein
MVKQWKPATHPVADLKHLACLCSRNKVHVSSACKESYPALFCHFLSSPEIPVFSVAVCFSLKGAEMESTALGVQAGIPGSEVRPHLPEVKKEPENDIAHQVENRTTSSICSEKGLGRRPVRTSLTRQPRRGKRGKRSAA